MRAEIRIIQNAEESNLYKKELASYEQTLSQLSTDIQGLKLELSRDQLFFVKDNRDSEMNLDNVLSERVGDIVLDSADNIQDKTQEALTNTFQMIQDTKKVGAFTLTKMEGQRQQLNTTGQNVERLENKLNRADKLIKRFRKRLATDKLIRCFTFVNVLLIVGIIVIL